MELYRKTLTLVKTINNHTLQKYDDIDEILHNGIINSPLLTFLEFLNAKNAKLSLNSPKDFSLRDKILIGEDIPIKYFKPDLVNKDIALYKRVYIFKIKGFDYVNNRYITFGYLFLMRSKPFTLSETNVIKFVADVFGEHILKRTILTFEKRNLKNEVAIQQYQLEDKKPGTIVLKFLHYLVKGSNASFGFFCVIDDKQLMLDYAVENKGEKSKINLSKFQLDITNSPINIYDSDFVYIPHSTQLTTFLSKISNKIDLEFSYSIYYVKNDLSIIGIWILAFSKFDYTNLEKSKSTFRYLNTIIDENYKYIFQRKTNKMIINPIFKSRDTKENDNIFVLMPFTLEWSDRIWTKIIKPTIESIGLTVKRADNLFGEDIVEDIWSEILSSKIIIADITERNPNVFYELGIAHTLGKNVILLTQNVNDIPFDLNRYRHIIYKDNFDGYEILRNQLVNTIKTILNNK